MNTLDQTRLRLRNPNLGIRFKNGAYEQRHVLHTFRQPAVNKNRPAGHVLGCLLHQTDIQQFDEVLAPSKSSTTPNVHPAYTPKIKIKVRRVGGRAKPFKLKQNKTNTIFSKLSGAETKTTFRY